MKITTITRPADLESSPAPIRLSDSVSLLEEDLASVPVFADSSDAETVRIPFSSVRGTFGADGSSSPIGDRLRVTVLALSSDPAGDYPAPVSERLAEIVNARELRIVGEWESAGEIAGEILEAGAELVLRISE
jgi:hypothetical protein